MSAVSPLDSAHAAAVPANLVQWRKSMRAELIARREAAPLPTRRDWSLAISLMLLHALPVQQGSVIGYCWPYRGEYDPRPLLRRMRERGIQCALPVVRQRGEALIFRAWTPGVQMAQGPLGIAYPVQTAQVDPDVLLIPLVGFGRAGDRLGYGGGYFDRTLASFARRPLCVGVGFELARMESTYPQAHDIPMDAIVTELAMHRVVSGTLEQVSAAQLREHLNRLAQERAGRARNQAHTIS
jgi:5-formyltetrahydrofolate cyclo-ligase